MLHLHMLRSVVFILLSCALAGSWAFWLLAWACTRRFFRRRESLAGAFVPRVSVLKPIKGADEQAMENFASFCRQDYADYELIFGVADADDPGAVIVRELQRQFPHRAIRLIVAPTAANNPKSSTLEHLSREAGGDVMVISDSDVRVNADYLRAVVAPLSDLAVGLVTCPYVGAQARTWAALLEALHMDATFLPAAILAHEWLGNCVGMGATLAIRKADLMRLGGYGAFRDHLMDDYQLAERVRRLGLQTRISRHVVRIVLGRTPFNKQWAREVRWARGIRVTSPGKYPGLLLTYSTPLAVALACAAGLNVFSLYAILVSLLLRWAIAWDIEGIVGERRASRHLRLALLPVRDFLSFLVWCAGAVGHTVEWRGERFLLHRDGRLERMPANSPSHGAAVQRKPGRFDVLAPLVRYIDRTLRRRAGIFDFSDDPQCMFRVSIAPSDQAVTLCDGAQVRMGDEVGQLHLFNEQVPHIPPEGPGLAWAMRAQRQAAYTMELLAIAVRSDERLTKVQAFIADSVFTPRRGFAAIRRVAGRLGFEVHDPARPEGILHRLHDWGENLLIWALLRTFNPAGLHGAKLVRERHRFWISREKLLAMHAHPLAPEAPTDHELPTAADRSN
jgi:ceramide glucosyltransferase